MGVSFQLRKTSRLAVGLCLLWAGLSAAAPSVDDVRPLTMEEIPAGDLKAQLENVANRTKRAEALKVLAELGQDAVWTDPSYKVVPEGDVEVHDEEAPEDAMAESPKERERRQTARARFPDVDQYNMPLLHSKRWAHNKMFLNFQGEVIHNTSWNNPRNNTSSGGGYSPITVAPYYAGGRVAGPMTFSDEEAFAVGDIFLRLAELFVAFDVDVTTERPEGCPATCGAGGSCYTCPRTVQISTFAGSKLDVDTSPTINGAQCAVGGCKLPAPGSGGVAWVSAWSRTSAMNPRLRPTFNYNGRNNPTSTRTASITAAHEAGHNFGLGHDMVRQPGGGAQSMTFTGNAGTKWIPVMGGTFAADDFLQFTNGSYPNASNTQDDLRIMASRLGYTPEAVSGGDMQPWPALAFDGLPYSAHGVITNGTEAGMHTYTFSAPTGFQGLFLATTRFSTLFNHPKPIQLNFQARVLGPGGRVVCDIRTPDLRNTEPVVNCSMPPQPAGTYTVTIRGIGSNEVTRGAPLFSSYGCVGSYTMNLTLSAVAGVPPPPPSPPTLRPTALPTSYTPCGCLHAIDSRSCDQIRPSPATLPPCNGSANGEFCLGSGVCAGTSSALNNCGSFDVYYKSPAQVQGRAGTCGVILSVNSSDCGLAGTFRSLANCRNAACNTYCEADGECGTSNRRDNCNGADDDGWDIYYKTCPDPQTLCPGTAPTMPPPTTSAPTRPPSCGCPEPVDSATCARLGPFGQLPSCNAASLGQYCEGSGECSTSDSLNNCGGSFDVYQKTHFPVNGGIRQCGINTPIASSTCSDLNSFNLPNCLVSPCNHRCEGDGECGTTNRLNNCGNDDVYFKTCPDLPCPTPAPTAAPTRTPTTAAPTRDCGCLEVIDRAVCSSLAPNALSLPRCDETPYGQLCDGNGECGTSETLNNCPNGADVYRKVLRTTTGGVGVCGANTRATSDNCSAAGRFDVLPNCLRAPCNSYCEGDGECGTSNAHNTCPGGWDVYYKTCPLIVCPTWAPTTDHPTQTPTAPTQAPTNAPTLTPTVVVSSEAAGGSSGGGATVGIAVACVIIAILLGVLALVSYRKFGVQRQHEKFEPDPKNAPAFVNPIYSDDVATAI